MKRTLADLAQDAYVRARVKAKTDQHHVSDTPPIEIPSLPPFSLGIKHKKERKNVIRTRVKKQARVVHRTRLFADCISAFRPVPIPVLIELGRVARTLYENDNDSQLQARFERLKKDYFKIGHWNQDEYDPGTGNGNIYAVRYMGRIYMIVYDFEGECVCSLPITATID